MPTVFVVTPSDVIGLGLIALCSVTLVGCYVLDKAYWKFPKFRRWYNNKRFKK